MRVILYIFINLFCITGCFYNSKNKIDICKEDDSYYIKLLGIDKIKYEKFKQALLKEKKRYEKHGQEELEWEDKNIPKSLNGFLRVVIGQSRNEFIQDNNFQDLIFDNQEFKYDNVTNTFYSKRGIIENSKTQREFEKFLKLNKIKKYNFVSKNIKREGAFTLRHNDITIDILEKHSDIRGDAWDPNIIKKIKKKLNGNRVQGIIFERISLMPLNFNKYILDCIKRNIYFYKLEYEDNEKLNLYKKMHNLMKKIVYKSLDLKFYPEAKKEKLKLRNIKYDHNIKKSLDPKKVYIKYPDSNSIDNISIPDLKEIVDTKKNIPKNPILKMYYDILAPGGKIIFMSASSGLNRHGGIVFKFNNSLYSPFKDLNDKNLKDLYKNIFERAGFRNIKFLKDKYFKEDILYIIAYKPL